MSLINYAFWSDEEVCARSHFAFTNDDLTHNVQKLVKGFYASSFRDPNFVCVMFSAPQATTVKIPSVRDKHLILPSNTSCVQEFMWRTYICITQALELNRSWMQWITIYYAHEMLYYSGTGGGQGEQLKM